MIREVSFLKIMNEIRYKKYGGKYMKVTGTLGSMNSEGKGFSLKDNSQEQTRRNH